MTGIIDHLLFLTIAVGLPVYGVLSWRRLERRVARRVEEARLASYTETIVFEWALAVAVLTAWLAAGRTAASIGLAASPELPFAVTSVVSLSLALLLLQQVRAVQSATADVFDGLRRQMTALEPLMPHTPGERSVFVGVSVTAGFCEELVYRGFLMAYLVPWLGVWGAVAGSAILFGMAHAYQDAAGLLKATTVGVVLAGSSVYAGSLWPAILLHAALDLQGGAIGYAAFLGSGLESVENSRSDTGAGGRSGKMHGFKT